MSKWASILDGQAASFPAGHLCVHEIPTRPVELEGEALMGLPGFKKIYF